VAGVGRILAGRNITDRSQPNHSQVVGKEKRGSHRKEMKGVGDGRGVKRNRGLILEGKGERARRPKFPTQGAHIARNRRPSLNKRQSLVITRTSAPLGSYITQVVLGCPGGGVWK